MVRLIPICGPATPGTRSAGGAHAERPNHQILYQQPYNLLVGGAFDTSQLSSKEKEMKRNCLKCGAEFVVGRRKNKVYCSRRCAHAAFCKRFRDRRPESTKRYERACFESLKKIVRDYKLAHPCPCGELDPVCLQLHHRDPKTKKFTISNVMRSKSESQILKEIEKCDVLCANCHLKYHYLNPVLSGIRN